MSQKWLITLDGPAGVGKTTLAKRLARFLGVCYLDTGAMFRGVAYFLGQEKINYSERDLAKEISDYCFELKTDRDNFNLYLNGKLLGNEIRTEEVAQLASIFAAKGVVRNFLKKAQQDLAQRFSLVAEGRDMGTVVFPWAKPKFFLQASPEVRAERRYKQLLAQGKTDADLNLILEQIKKRDEQDLTRKLAPLRPAVDAIVIDTSDLEQEEVFELLKDYVLQHHSGSFDGN